MLLLSTMSNYDSETFYSSERNAIVLPIDPIKGLPRTVRYEDEVLYRVPRPFVTICSLAHIEALEQPSKHRSNVLHAISRQLAFNTVTFGGFTERLSVCQKDDGKTKSIISGAEVLGLSEWVQGVRADAAIKLPMPYPYVTLYTRGDKQGVSIDGIAQLNARCQSLEMPEVEVLLRSS